MLVCGALLTGALYAIDLPWQAALAAGMALALSSTAIAVQTMSERNLLSAPVGRAGFSVLLFQDIAAIPLIALVPLLGVVENSGDPAWMTAGKAFGAIAVVIAIGVFLTPPLMRLIARSRVREIFTAFALLLVIGIAELMSLAGLSMALGAFLAGVLLASSEYRHALETDIGPFKGLLLGLFFIAVGMSIDFGLVLGQPQVLAMLVVGPARDQDHGARADRAASRRGARPSAGCSPPCSRRRASSRSSSSASRATRACSRAPGRRC